MIDVILFVVEWLGAALLGLSILWYPVKTGWRRLGAPLVGVSGCLGFLIVGIYHGLWGVAALNGSMVLLNAWNLLKARRERYLVARELDRLNMAPENLDAYGHHRPTCRCVWCLPEKG